MRRINVLAAAGLLVGLGATLTSTASAQSLITFGQSFTNDTTPIGSIVYNKATGKLTVSGGAAGVSTDFLFKRANGYTGTNIPVDSVFTFTADVNGAASITGGNLPGNSYVVNFTNIQFAFTATTPGAFGKTNLLSGTFATGKLLGSVQQGAANFSSDVSQDPLTTGVVGYSSDFLDFTNTDVRKFASEQFALALSAVNDGGGGKGPTFDANNNLNSFVADPTGTFSSNPVPPGLTPTPAPPGVVSGLIGIAMGGAQFGMVRFRKRRRAQKTEAAA